ncbi:MAG TPA: FAD-binding and (Fe-S)-binding domain-containing protein [Armatimonadota bacterium]|nr:FAD-binding and (Fe-S)-binding domain-containing protein [Armatimonadota bacterium]
MSLSERVEQALKEKIKGEVRFDHTTRLLYSTDASNYQFMPMGVVLPRDEEDVLAAILVASEEKIPVTPRGAGTSLAGQTLGEGIILDFSKYMNKIIEVDPIRRVVRVEPGCVLAKLNDALKPHKLVLGPDPATQNRCNIGGMVANNSSGSHSLVYGKTLDHTAALKCILSDGSVLELAQLPDWDMNSISSGASKSNDRAAQIASEVWNTIFPHKEEILARYPKIPRRVSGYNFDTVLESEHFNLADLVVGSEGTLAAITEATLTVSDLPSKKGLALLAFPDRFSALDSVPILLKTNTQVLEMIDYRLLAMARESPEHRHKMAMVGDAQGVLILEFADDEEEPILQDLDGIKKMAKDLPGSPECITVIDQAAQDAVWDVRESGLGLLARRVGEIKSVEFVEDTAVSPEWLGEYVRRAEEIFARHGTTSAIYGHAGQGCLHIRLDMTLRTAEGVRQMRAIAEEITDLVIEFGGVYSGEHGDGISRSEFLPKLYGERIMDLHRQVKKVFDPVGIMNPGKIVDPLPMDANLWLGPDYKSMEPSTYFDFSTQQGYNMAIESCNGIGACRKMDAGTMCPSYVATMDEMHSTRGRANALREALKGNFDGLGDQRVLEVLDLCLECKACKRECPVGVDMAKYKAEYLAQYYDIHGIPTKIKAFGYIDFLAAFGSRMPWLANWVMSGPLSGFVKNIAGIHPKRKLPMLAGESFSSWFEKSEYGRSEDRQNVILLDDAFNNYFTPEVLKAAVEVLDCAGFGIILPPSPVSCGRAFLSKGMLKHARAAQAHLVNVLAPLVEQGMKIVGLEPSEVLSLRDEMPLLVRDSRTKLIAENSFTFEEFLVEFAPDWHPGKLEGHALVHGHCHQKAICGTDSISKLLGKIEGLRFTILDSGCCGMAGAFGYEKDHYEISRLIGERVLLPAIRALPPEDYVVADGFSCRSQISDFCSNRRALHIAELLALAE